MGQITTKNGLYDMNLQMNKFSTFPINPVKNFDQHFTYIQK